MVSTRIAGLVRIQVYSGGVNRGAAAKTDGRSAAGLTAMGCFLLFGAVTATVAGVTLAWPGTNIDRIWDLNPRAYKELAPFGRMVGIPFLLLGATLGVGCLGWLQRRVWGWWLAVIVIGVQVLGDVFNIFLGRISDGAVGVAIAGALFLYLLSPRVRSAFAARNVEGSLR
ncbi:MAG TPA: hypothetical protein VGJ06_21215 [Candidatus Acidoferrum sp.]|jgi:hypothetical protein